MSGHHRAQCQTGATGFLGPRLQGTWGTPRISSFCSSPSFERSSLSTRLPVFFLLWRCHGWRGGHGELGHRGDSWVCFPETVSQRDRPYTCAVAIAGVSGGWAVPGRGSTGLGDRRRPRGTGPYCHLVTYTGSLALKRLQRISPGRCPNHPESSLDSAKPLSKGRDSCAGLPFSASQVGGKSQHISAGT